MAEPHVVQLAQQIALLSLTEKYELLDLVPDLLSLARWREILQSQETGVKENPEIGETRNTNQQQPDEETLSRNPFAKHADAQRAFQRFAHEMIEKLGGDPQMSTEEIQAEIGKFLKEKNELSRMVIAMREE